MHWQGLGWILIFLVPDVAEAQEVLLEESQRELEKRKEIEEALREALRIKQAERLDIEERYSDLQEEAAGKSRKLRKVWSLRQAAEAEITDMRRDHEREMEGYIDSVRQLSRELKLNMLIIDTFIPEQFQVSHRGLTADKMFLFPCRPLSKSF